MLEFFSKDRYVVGTGKVENSLINSSFIMAHLNYLRGPDFKNHEYFGFEDRNSKISIIEQYKKDFGVNMRDCFEFWDALNHDFKFLS